MFSDEVMSNICKLLLLHLHFSEDGTKYIQVIFREVGELENIFELRSQFPCPGYSKQCYANCTEPGLNYLIQANLPKNNEPPL